MTLAAFLAFAGLSLLAAISPGPAVLMAARTGLTEGFRTGAWLAGGIGLGAVIWASAALFGLGVLFALAPALLWAFKIMGATYLLWLSWNLWRSARMPLDLSATPALPRSARSAFVLGLVTQLANPKPAILFAAIFLGTVPATTPLWVLGALLAVVFLNEALWNMAVARIFSLSRARAGYITLKTLIDRCFSAGLAALSVKIVAT